MCTGDPTTCIETQLVAELGCDIAHQASRSKIKYSRQRHVLDDSSNNHPGFNGLAEPYLIGDQYAAQPVAGQHMLNQTHLMHESCSFLRVQPTLRILAQQEGAE